MSKRLPLSVVICTMNRPDSLERTLRTLVEQESIPSQVIVIDQSQSVITRERVQQVVDSVGDYTRAECFHQEEPSLTRARNHGLSHCQYDVVAFCDDDIDVERTTIAEIHSTMQDPDVAMIAGLDSCRSSESSNRSALLGYMFCRKSWRRRRQGHVTLGMFGRLPNQIHEDTATEWAMGFLCIFRKSLLSKWALKWDESLKGYAYPEDLDLSFGYWKRANADGLRCIVSPRVRVAHLVSPANRTPSFTHTLMFVVHREYLSYKHSSHFRARLATRWANVGEFLRRLPHRESALDLLAAQWYCDRHRAYLRGGQVPPVLGLQRAEVWWG